MKGLAVLNIDDAISKGSAMPTASKVGSRSTRLSSRQESDFESFYRANASEMVRLASLILCSQAQAEEVVQDIFFKTHERWTELNNPQGFLRTAVVNKCKDSLRRRTRLQERLKILRREASQKTHTTLMADLQSEHQFFAAMLQKLKPRRRTVIVMKFYGGYTMREVSEMLDIPEGTVRSDVRRGLEQLRQVLDEE